jgi:hypothetical protein
MVKARETPFRHISYQNVFLTLECSSVALRSGVLNSHPVVEVDLCESFENLLLLDEGR